MKPVGEVVNVHEFLAKRQEQETKRELDQKSVDIVNRLFVFFESICRGFDKQYGRDSRKLNIEKIQWARGFMDCGIKRIEQLEFGIKKCRRESPINTPTLGQFIKWCTPTPEELGIPSLEQAYDEAVRNSHFACTDKQWSHQAVYHAWSMCSSYELANLPKANSFPIFERNYVLTVKMIMRQEPLKEIPIAITHDKESVPRQRIAKGFEQYNSRQSAMDAMRNMLGACR